MPSSHVKSLLRLLPVSRLRTRALASHHSAHSVKVRYCCSLVLVVLTDYIHTTQPDSLSYSQSLSYFLQRCQCCRLCAVGAAARTHSARGVHACRLPFMLGIEFSIDSKDTTLYRVIYYTHIMLFHLLFW